MVRGLMASTAAATSLSDTLIGFTGNLCGSAAKACSICFSRQPLSHTTVSAAAPANVQLSSTESSALHVG